MKAVYKKTILDKLLELKYEADHKGKKIDYFLLTPQEWDELRNEREAFYHIQYPMGMSTPNSRPTEVTYTYVDLKHRSDKYMTKRFMMIDMTIFGERIVVAPSEYH